MKNERTKIYDIYSCTLTLNIYIYDMRIELAWFGLGLVHFRMNNSRNTKM